MTWLKSTLFIVLPTLIGCSSEPDIRSLLGDDGSLTPASIGDDELISIRVHRSNTPDSIDVIAASIHVDIEPDGSIHARKKYAEFVEGEAPRIVTEEMDEARLSADQLQGLRNRLAAYRPVDLTNQENVLLPRDCDIAVGSFSPIIINFEDEDGRSGSFVMPYGCDSAGSSVIKTDLHLILESLPALKGVEASKIRMI